MKSEDKKKSRLKKDTTEPVRIEKDIVGAVRNYKKNERGSNIGTFFGTAALEKLASIKQKDSHKI